jgi:hypothetical protein
MGMTHHAHQLMGRMGNVARMTHMTHDIQARACLYVYDINCPGQGYLTHGCAPWAR